MIDFMVLVRVLDALFNGSIPFAVPVYLVWVLLEVTIVSGRYVRCIAFLLDFPLIPKS